MLGRSLKYHTSAAVVLALLAGASSGAVGAPVVDSKTPSPVTNVSREQLENLPTGRQLEDLIRTCPAQTIPTITTRPQTLIDGIPTSPPPSPNCIQPDDLRMIEVYKAHNAVRAEYGVTPLQWNPVLAGNAQTHANRLAQIGQLVHASREGRGTERENISQGLPSWNANQLMGSWLRERQFFTPGIFPNVSTTGDWYQVGHYSQMIWPTTTDIGCGMASGGGFSWLVCRYNPGGNKDGKTVGLPPMPSPRHVVGSPPAMPSPRHVVGSTPAMPQLRAVVATTPAMPQMRGVVGSNPPMPQLRGVVGSTHPQVTRWIDVKTLKPVNTVPAGILDGFDQANAVESGRAFNPRTGQNFARQADGSWIDVKTLKPVNTVPAGILDGFDQANAVESGRAFNPRTGQNFAKEPVPPTKADASAAATPPK